MPYSRVQKIRPPFTLSIILWSSTLISAGKYLGSHVEFNQEVLGHFVRCHQFEQLLLVQALRQFLWSFRYKGLFAVL